MLRNADSRAPVVSSQMAWLTRRRGEMSTAWRRTTPAEPMRVESSRGPELMTASTMTWRGFSPVRRAMMAQDADSLDLLAGVASVLHEGAGDTLDERALSLLEAALLPAAGRVRNVARIGGLDGQVIGKGHVGHGDLIEWVLVEKFDLVG